METKGDKLGEQGGIDLDQTLPGFNPEDAAAVILSDDNETDFPINTPQAVSTPKVELAWGQKQPLEDRSPCSSPPKKRATEEKEESLPPHEAVLPKGVMEEDILPKRYEIFTSDNDWVQHVRCSLLGLEAGIMPSRRDIDTSSHFIPQAAASESDLPEVITKLGCLFSGGKASSWSAPQTSSLPQQTGSLCTLTKVCRNIFWWHYPPFQAKAHQA